MHCHAKIVEIYTKSIDKTLAYTRINIRTLKLNIRGVTIGNLPEQ